jgi:t-SNARE complex subunit (syntaxin)
MKEGRNNTNKADGNARAARLDEADLFVVFVGKIVVVVGVAGVV